MKQQNLNITPTVLYHQSTTSEILLNQNQDLKIYTYFFRHDNPLTQTTSLKSRNFFLENPYSYAYLFTTVPIYRKLQFPKLHQSNLTVLYIL